MTRAQRAKRASPTFRHAYEVDRKIATSFDARGSHATCLHDLRLDAVMQTLFESAARTVLDLGCGEGELLVHLAQHSKFEHVIGIDISPDALVEARRILDTFNIDTRERFELALASFAEANEKLKGFDAGILLETIEHIDLHLLPLVEYAVFGSYRPTTVIITTPNREYNVLYGMQAEAFRHPDHRFEWDRKQLQEWSLAVAERNGYMASFYDIGPVDEVLGASTQMAVFNLIQE